LRLFDLLQEPSTAAQVSTRAGLDERGVEIILDALAAAELVVKQERRYRNSPLAAAHLREDSPSRTLWYLDHVERMYRTWGYLPETIRRGSPPGEELGRLRREEGATLDFIRAMHALTLPKAAPLLAACNLSGLTRVVDVGGGPGTYLIELARRSPRLECILVDLAEPLQIAATFIAEAGLANRIELVERDITRGEEPYTEGADLAILSQILHSMAPRESGHILALLHASLAPGGKLLLQEFILDEAGTSPRMNTLFAVNMLAATAAGRAWKGSQLRAWLDQAGFGPHRPLEAAMESQAWLVERDQAPTSPR